MPSDTLTFQSNPFSTRWTRPGACPFLFPPQVTLQQLTDQLAADRGWGQIVGVHGSGKSTLLSLLLPRLHVPVIHFTLSRGQGSLPVSLKDPQLQACHQVIVDGYEQLSRWQRYQLKHFCRCSRKGLLVTTHKPLGLPTLFSTEPSLELAQRLVAYLQRNQAPRIVAADVCRHYPHHSHNLRELFFSLYDLFERRRP